MTTRNDEEWKQAWTDNSGLPMAARIPDRQANATRPLSIFSPPGWEQQQASRAISGSFILDGSGTILAFDRNMERLTGWDAMEVVGHTKDLGVYGPPDEQGVRAFCARPLYEGAILPGDRVRPIRLTLTRRDGVQLEVEALLNPLGGPARRVAVDVQRVLARMAAPAEEIAEDRDPQTGLPTIQRFLVSLREHFQETQAEGRPLSLLLVDIDHLQSINEEFGRDRGDRVLQHVAGILNAAVRASDIVARIENDNFVVLLPGTGRGDARHVGGRIRKAIEEFAFLVPDTDDTMPVTVSIGVACYPADAEVPSDLIRRANEALSEVHRLGRNRVWCYVRRPRIAVDVPVYFDGPAAHLLGTSRDLSNSGIFVDTHDALPTGMRVGLTFRLPGQDGPVRVIGRVIRHDDDMLATRGTHGLGIEFERYSDEDRWRLESFLHQTRG